MAIEKDKLLEVLNGEGELDAKVDSIIGMVNEDFESQLTAIKLNREQIKEEKKAEIAKKHALEEQIQSFKEENEKLNKQLAAAAPDEVQKIYDQKLQDAQNVFEAKRLEMQTLSETQKARIKELESIQLQYECEQEFNKAISGKNIAPDSLADFKEFVLGHECVKFSRKPYGEGQTILATKDGLTIKQATENACNTTFGKNCMLNNSFGGGAEGGSKTPSVTNNPFKKETLNLTEQGRLYREDPALYKALKAQAGL